MFTEIIDLSSPLVSSDSYKQIRLYERIIEQTVAELDHFPNPHKGKGFIGRERLAIPLWKESRTESRKGKGFSGKWSWFDKIGNDLKVCIGVTYWQYRHFNNSMALSHFLQKQQFQNLINEKIALFKSNGTVCYNLSSWITHTKNWSIVIILFIRMMATSQ